MKLYLKNVASKLMKVVSQSSYKHCLSALTGWFLGLARFASLAPSATPAHDYISILPYTNAKGILPASIRSDKVEILPAVKGARRSLSDEDHP